MKTELKTIIKRPWKTEDIHYWTNPENGVINASVLFDGKLSRLRAGIIIVKGNQILLGEEEDEPGVFSLPGGSINQGETPVEAAIREAQEEVGITAVDVEEAGCDYCECHDEVKDWVKENVPEEEWWYNYYTCLCIGQYKEPYKGKVDKVDQDKSMKKSAEFYDIDEVIDDPSFKYAWKKALYNYGYLEDDPVEIEEAYTSNVVKLNTAGYVTPDGMIITLDEYHGEDPSLRDLGYVEFSNTHPEVDTCVRIYQKPTAQQYTQLQRIIDLYLDIEEYCKVEIWNNGKYEFYKIYSLVEDACEDYFFEEEIGNWTGYKLVQIIKNYFNNKLDEKIVKVDGKWQVQSEKGRNMGTYDTEEEAKKRLQQIHYFKHLNEGILVEKSRSALINQSKSAGSYKKGKGNRWTQKNKCSVASTVKDYNKVDMDTFWKQDKLKFGVKVQGETNEYLVTVVFDRILPLIQEKIKANKNLLEFKCIYDALVKAINLGDVLVSCTCPDYKYRFKYWASKEGYEAEGQEVRAAKITNPDNDKGAACKHILAVLNNVEWLKKIASVINNYINYCKDNMQYNYSKYMFPKLYGIDYNKAIQMHLDDYDENGNIRDELKSDPATLNLVNALGKVRGRIQKGSNKNPVAKKQEESLQEAYDLDEELDLLESFDETPDLERHYHDHCVKGKFDSTILFKNYKTKEEYKRGAEDFILHTKKGNIKVLGERHGKPPVVCYYKWKQEADSTYTYAQYFISPRDKKRKITTFMRYGQFEFATVHRFRYTTYPLPERENTLTDFNVILTDEELAKIKEEEQEILKKEGLKTDTKKY